MLYSDWGIWRVIVIMGPLHFLMPRPFFCAQQKHLALIQPRP